MRDSSSASPGNGSNVWESVPSGTMPTTCELAGVDGVTRVQIRADDVPAGIRAEDHAVGLASSLANLAAYVEP